MSGDFDKAIDRAVREMLDVEPPAGMRARVLRRIALQAASGSGGKDRFSRTIFWLAAPIAAAAMMALAVLLPQRATPPPAAVVRVETPRPPVPPPAPAPASGPSLRSAPNPAQGSGAPRVAATRRPSVTTAADRIVAAASVGPADDTTGIEPLQSIAPIRMAPLAEHRVATSDISVRPLNEITEVQIAPLNPPDGRN